MTTEASRLMDMWVGTSQSLPLSHNYPPSVGNSQTEQPSYYLATSSMHSGGFDPVGLELGLLVN